MTRWQRPPGPLNVWNVVDGYENLPDGTRKPVKFSIQDIPNEENRKEEVYRLLRTNFLEEEPCSKSTNIKEDPDGVDDFMTIWKYGMTHGVSIGCYKLDSDGKIGQLAGVNLMYIMTDETVKDFEKIQSNLKSEKFKKIWNFLADISANINVFEIFQVDKYISSVSLSVDPAFRGQKLGYYILDARTAVGKKYGIQATSTVFTAHASQRQAERAGFETRNSIDYAEYVDDQGNPHFPNTGMKSAKIMMKKLF